MEFPFEGIKKGEINKFPYAILEIKVKDGGSTKKNEWIEDLMSSHLVKEAPRFSKFVHGVAELFEDYINTFPFWMSIMDTDIRRDPEIAFQEEQEKKAKQAQDEFAVGSFLGGRSATSFKAAAGSSAGRYATSQLTPRAGAKAHLSESTKVKNIGSNGSHYSDGEDMLVNQPESSTVAGLRSIFPSLSTSKYAQAHRQATVQLPPGVRDPGKWIKDAGPVRVEPKVWLANQR
jgi:hypothetical protein